MRSVWPFGVVGGVLIALLRYFEYRWLVVQHSVEIYSALIALCFAGLGLWLGAKLARGSAAPSPAVVDRAPPPPASFCPDPAQVVAHHLTARELEILGLIAHGLTNKEIAKRLFVSENTVKTHSSHLFDKLRARRRTEAVKVGRECGLIP